MLLPFASCEAALLYLQNLFNLRAVVFILGAKLGRKKIVELEK